MITQNPESTLMPEPSDDVTPLVTFNLVRHPTAVLCKTLRLDTQGQLVKEPGARIPQGSSVTTLTTTLSQYAEIVFGGGTRQYALPANVELGQDVPLTVKEIPWQGAVDRSAATMRFVPSQAVVTLDHDPSGHGQHLADPEALYQLLKLNLPNTFKENTAWTGYFSSGSYIYSPNGVELVGARGHHTAFAVDDATDIPRFRDALFQRLWLAGQGFIFITKSGAMLPRTVFDAKVLEPQQPVFAGGAQCDSGLEQRRPKLKICPGEYLDTRSLPSLSAEEFSRYQTLVEEAKTHCKTESDRQRRAYQASEVDRLVRVGMDKVRARRTVEYRLEGTLVGEDSLEFSKIGKVTVAEVLAHPERFDEQTLCDPLEPDYGSASTAMFFANSTNGEPLVHSFAHGGQTFFLRHDERSLSARLEAIPIQAMNDNWSDMLVKARLEPDAVERVLQAVKRLSGVPIRALRESFRAKVRLNEGQQGEIQDPGLVLARMTLAERYADGAHLLRTQDGTYWRYIGTHWVVLSELLLKAEIQSVAEVNWEAISMLYKRLGRKEAPLISAAVNTASQNLASLVIRPGDPLGLNGRRKSVINLRNGELWLEDEGPVLKPHRPESFLTSCAAFDYDPDAEAPTFELALRGMLSNLGGVPFADQDEMLRYLLELLGYICQTGRWLKVFILIVGPGDNGKSQLIKLLEHLVGLKAIAYDRLSAVDEQHGRFASARLIGKLILVDDDADHNTLLPDGFLKKIAEEKPMTGERKFRDEMTFVAQVVPIILANSWPRSRDLSRGMRTRAQVLHLPRAFVKPSETTPEDPDIQRPELWQTILQEELPGVLNLLVAAYNRLRQRGHLLIPDSAKKAFDMWWGEVNVVSRFVTEACEKDSLGKPGHTTSIFKVCFDVWASENKIQTSHRPALNALKEKFEELGFRVAHGNQGTTVYGLRVKTEWLGKGRAQPTFSDEKLESSLDDAMVINAMEGF